MFDKSKIRSANFQKHIVVCNYWKNLWQLALPGFKRDKKTGRNGKKLNHAMIGTHSFSWWEEMIWSWQVLIFSLSLSLSPTKGHIMFFFFYFFILIFYLIDNYGGSESLFYRLIKRYWERLKSHLEYINWHAITVSKAKEACVLEVKPNWCFSPTKLAAFSDWTVLN